MLDVEDLQVHRKSLLFVLGSVFCGARFFNTPHCLRNVFDFGDELINVQTCDESKGVEPNLCRALLLTRFQNQKTSSQEKKAHNSNVKSSSGSRCRSAQSLKC